MEITYANLLSGLYIAVAIMLLIVLYHVLFIVVDVRKIVHHIATLTDEVKHVMMKPISVADKAMDWAMHQLEHMKHKKEHHHKED